MIVDPKIDSKTARDEPKWVQEGSESDICSCCFLPRFWIVLGPILSSEIVSKKIQRFSMERLVFDLVIGWSQDGRQDRPGRAQEPPRASQEPSKTLKRAQNLPRAAQGPPKTVQRGPKSLQERHKKPNL